MRQLPYLNRAVCLPTQLQYLPFNQAVCRPVQKKKKSTKNKKRRRAANGATKRGIPLGYPKHPILKCLRIPQAVLENNAGKECTDREAARFASIGWSGQIFKANPQGCPTCGGLGYKGRVGIHELMVNDEALTAGINKEVETAELKRIAMKSGMKTLHQDSMLKCKMGLTTIEESLSNVPPDLIL